MYNVTYTYRNESFLHKLRCALTLNGLMRVYPEVELKMKRDECYVAQIMVKEKDQPFSIRDYMKLDLYDGSKVLVSVSGAYINEQELAERICIAMSRIY